MECECEKLGWSVQLFRIRQPSRWFEEIADAGPAPGDMLGARKVWRCRRCGQFFALLRIPLKDEVDFLVRAPDDQYLFWNWPDLADQAGQCGWRGAAVEDRYVL